MNWQSVCVAPTDSVRETIQKIDASSLQIALVIDGAGHLLGTVTDGDVRRGILHGVSLEDPTLRVMNPHPTVASPLDDRDAVISAMRVKQVRHIPVVDEAGRLVGLEALDELLNPACHTTPVLLMAGGLGRRLSPMTAERPKPMLPIGNRPILETILVNFIQLGFRRFYISVNHCSHVITDYFGDGARFGVKIEYLREANRMGTAGALSLLPERLTEPILVMNGDVLTKVNFNQLLDFHVKQGVTGTMCIQEYRFQIPFGVIKLNGCEIMGIEEKPTHKFFINAGIYVLEPEAVEMVPSGTFYDMTSLFERLVAAGLKTAVFPLREYWLDIGQLSDLEKANGEFEVTFK